jgi:hypothetical protein
VTRTHPRRLGPLGVRGVRVGTTALLVAFSLAACADEPVTLESPSVSRADYRTCNQFLADLPHHLAGQEWRKVNPAAALGRAWGDPPSIVRCGVDVPPDFDQTAGCQVANGIGWYVPQSQIDDQGADAVFTAVGYRPVVELDVPHDYRPEGGAAAIAELADDVKQHLELVEKCD